ncbi:MAG: hypothetical protein GX987_04145 [Tissierellia bacterium]|nr:hypothetical protein [Tissierellia bacterium]
MDSTYKRVINKHAFVGIISSDSFEEEFKSYGKYLSDYFNSGGRMICINSKKEESQSLDYLGKTWRIDLNHIHNEGRIISICRDDYLKEDSIDIKGILKAIEKGLDQLNRKGSNLNQVYITVDYFWRSVEEDELKSIYNNLKTMSKERKTRFIFRYIMKDLKEEHIHILLRNHEVLLLDGVNDFEIYTPFQLIFRSLILLSKYYAVDEKYKKEMKRVEHLRSLGDLMEETVHDVNNLLTTISGYAQLSLATEQSSEVMDYLKIINKTALDGRNVIDKIKDHIRGSYDNKKDYYNLDHIVNNCIEMTRHKFKATYSIDKKRLKMDVGLNSKGYIYANEYEIRQAILNIILNGVDAMENGGILTIRTYDIKDQVVLEIADTGVGIKEEIINKIFDPYFTTKGSNGTGLGLNIVKRMVNNHNGQIHVNSKLGKGTQFTIYFPIVEYKYNIAETINKGYNNI